MMEYRLTSLNSYKGSKAKQELNKTKIDQNFFSMMKKRAEKTLVF